MISSVAGKSAGLPDTADDNTRVLITGASGRIGQSLVRWLEQNTGWKLVLTSRRRPEFDSDRSVWIQGDLRNAEDLDRIFSYRPGVIVHLASSVGNKNPVSLMDFENTELAPTLSMLGYILSKKLNVRFIFASSGGTVYKDSSEPHTETDQLQGSSFYSCNKIYVENLLWLYREVLHPVILRISNPFGMKVDPHIKQGIIDIAINCAVNNKIFSVYGDLNNVRDFIYIDDLCSAFVKTISLPASAVYEVFNIGSGVGLSLLQILEYVKKYFPGFQYRVDSKTSGDISCNVLNVSKAAEVLGWHPSLTVEAYLKSRKDLLTDSYVSEG